MKMWKEADRDKLESRHREREMLSTERKEFYLSKSSKKKKEVEYERTELLAKRNDIGQIRKM